MTKMKDATSILPVRIMPVRMLPMRIMIVDDHPMVRDGLTMRLSSQPDMDVCGEAASEDEAFERIQQISPDVVRAILSCLGR